MAKSSVQLYYSYIEQFELLNDEQLRKVIYAMIDYDKDNIIPNLESISKMAFSFIKTRIDYDKEQYERIVERNKTNGLLGGRPKNPVGYLGTQTNPDEPKKADIDIELDIIKENVKRKNYFDNLDVDKIFKEYLSVRVKLKLINSDRAINTLVNKLKDYTDDVKIKMIEQSIVNSWKSIYEIKDIPKKVEKKFL